MTSALIIGHAGKANLVVEAGFEAVRFHSLINELFVMGFSLLKESP